MQINLLKSKIHRATVTDANLDYEGSITIDELLMKAAGLLPYEMVSVANINNGSRFETYVIRGEAGSGTICLNGAAARLAQKGDLVIIFSSCSMDENEARTHRPTIVHVDAKNRETRLGTD